MRGAFVFDVDDVAVPFVPAFLEHVRTKFPQISDPYEARAGRKLDVTAFSPFGLRKVTGCTPELEKAAVLDFYGTDVFRHLPMAEGAAEALTSIAEMGFMPYALTSRPSTLRDLTRELFERNVPGVVQGYFFAGGQPISDTFRTKGDSCRKLGAAYFVDDSDHHVDSCIVESPGTRAIIFSNPQLTPWNVGYANPKAHRHEDWQGILQRVRNNGNA